jgi:hypothetical protein
MGAPNESTKCFEACDVHLFLLGAPILVGGQCWCLASHAFISPVKGIHTIDDIGRLYCGTIVAPPQISSPQSFTKGLGFLGIRGS